MIYTQAELEGMSDLMINKEAALFFHKHKGSISLHKPPSADGSVWVRCDGRLVNTNYNPCNNWDDCGALIDECELTIGWFSDRISKLSYCNNKQLSIQVGQENPKRAVTIVYILIKQGE